MYSDGSSRRRQHLINGRRVRLSDLLDAQLLDADDELIFERPRLGEVHRATVTRRGRIRLEDGQEFMSPSGASDAVTKVATDGWYAWRVGPSGPFLHDLRRQLLEAVASKTPEDDEPQSTVVVRRYEGLNAARERAERGDPEELTVRDLIRRWGGQDRDRELTAEIEADLANHGLSTVPDFRAVGLDTVVRLEVLSTPEDVENVAAPAVPSAPSLAFHVPAVSPSDEESEDIGRTLGNLLPDKHRLVSVSPSASLDEAVTEMLLGDYSQVPVLSGTRDLRGAVTWQSIAIARQAGGDATLSDAVIPVRDFPYNTRLLDVLGVLWSEEFVFVRAHDKQVYGIVTAADVVRVYDDMATPFFLIGELDQELRRLIRNRFEIEDLQRVCVSGENLTSYDDMTMGDYLSVIRNPDCWAKIGWTLDRKVVGTHLDELRKIRNKVTHFNPDPISSADVDRLRNFLTVIRAFDR
ncbi:hypothetical protein C8E87_7246 [Paractinoplanes brasiliensis]|uniref:CBS domain-containing protein n=2 Tax=Paractinoplanes brasiliensis TaxID=52695 RepID=A0A4R6J896_9ACTN|nr:hypothetical protein C8E87_7246 [Actinoplanes brasiliensis]